MVRVKNEHLELYGHIAQPVSDESGAKICFKCTAGRCKEMTFIAEAFIDF